MARELDRLARAQEVIDCNDTVIYDIAAEHGQIVDNVRHMRWFLRAVAAALPESFNAGDRVSALRYGQHCSGTVTRDARTGIVWVRWDGYSRETWTYFDSLTLLKEGGERTNA